jgi:Mycotoxin biosynthesis protein UstYa
MCSVDVTPIVLQWDEKAQMSFVRTDTLHSCRNFEKIRGWAKDNQLDRELIITAHAEDDLE